MSTPFNIKIYDAQGNYKSSISSVIDLNTIHSLDKISTLTFSMPMADPKTEHINIGCQFDVYDEKDGYLGRWHLASKKIVDNRGLATLEVKCYDALIELTRYTVGFFRNYNNEPLANVLEDIVGLAPNFNLAVEPNFGNTTATFQGSSVFGALDEFRDRFKAHFRLLPSRKLEFGNFGSASGIRFQQISAAIPHKIDNKKEIAVVTGIRLVEEGQEVYNNVIPLGFGQGISQLTIEKATEGDYSILSGTNQNGSNYYYIEDATSVANYGRRMRVLTFPQIRPLTNSDANVVNAANALKLTAEAYMKKHLVPKIEYEVDVVKLDGSLKVGDTVKLIYRGIVDGYKYIDVDQDFYVMDITRNRSVTGNRTYKVNISNVDVRRTSDVDVILETIQNVKNLNISIPASLAYSPIGTYTKRIKGDGTPANRIDAEFKVRIKDEVLYLNRAIMVLRTDTLKSSVTTSASSGVHQHTMFKKVSDAGTVLSNQTYEVAAQPGFPNPSLTYINLDIATGGFAATTLFTPEAEGSHTHDMTYGVFNDTTYPQQIGVIINGTDVTNELGGYFQSNNLPFETEIDITDYLVNATGGLRQTHTITIYALAGLGEIEFELDMLVTIQPIPVT